MISNTSLFRSFAFAACSLFLGASVFLMSSEARAEGPYKKPDYYYSLSETPVWNSNPLMLRQNVQDIYGTETKGVFGLQRNLLRSVIKLQLAAVRNQYIQKEFNSTDYYTQINAEHKFSRFILGLIGNYDHDTTRSGELTTFGQNVGTGRRDSYSLQPSAFYALSPRASIGVSGNWKENRYEYPTLTDYSIMAVMPTFRYALSPLQTITITIQGQRFTILDNTSQYIDSFGPYLTWDYNYSPLWTLSLSLGNLRSKNYGFASGSSEWTQSLIYGGSLKYNGLRTTLDLSVQRAQQPYANGTQSYLTTFQALDRYKINENLDFTLKGSYQTADQPASATGSLEKAWDGGMELNYRVGLNWKVDASYKYRQEQLTNVDETAQRQLVRMGLTYQFGK